MLPLISSAALMAAAAGCGAAEPSEGASPCQQTFEFGNTGCAELSGRVTDQSGQPVVGAHVSITGAGEPERAISFGSVGSVDVETGAAGDYRLRVIRVTGEPPSGRPDTVTVCVRSVVALLNPPPGAAAPRDSVQALLTVRAVGELPVVTSVATLSIPSP
jgi:hypothetical protein